MGKITFISADGSRTEVQVEPGESIMRIALNAGIEGLVAECGGCLSCATCHCYVEGGWADRIPPASAEEEVMVECAIDVRDTSRLSCQIQFTEEMDGIEIEIPATQY
ncbi:MAG: 2Fe-2S iron-sulfur cluster-binding protein [Novosphingobium sp.]|nr:2Fe-2S iron-sulfur cluster-binding protein [Novosphingobium sp.]